MATTIFNADWWFLQLPRDWTGKIEEQGASFRRRENSGVLQISVARKNDDNVSETDIAAFIAEQHPPPKILKPVTCGRLSGLFDEQRASNILLTRWWLSYRRLLFFASFTQALDSDWSERRLVEEILETITPRSEYSD